MKVLKPGRPQTGWAKEFECTGRGNGGGGCGAQLLVEHRDLKRYSWTDFGGGTETSITFTCCACGVKTDIEHYNGPRVS